MLKITRIHYSRYFFFVYLYTGANLLQIVGIEKGGVFFSYMMHKDTLKNMEMWAIYKKLVIPSKSMHFKDILILFESP